MSSELNKGSAVYRNEVITITYDLNTQQGRIDFWNYILNIIGGETLFPGLIACRWNGEDNVFINFDGETYQVTGQGQILIHGIVQNIQSWSTMTLCVINPYDNQLVTLRLVRGGSTLIELALNSH